MQTQLESSAVVVLQNCHGLELLAMAQGVSCAMLKEQCSFWVN